MQEKERKERAEVLRSVALALREWRIASGLSQEQLANEGLNRSHVSALESGEIDPKFTTLWRIARILDVRLSVLIRDIEFVYGEDLPGDNKPLK